MEVCSSIAAYRRTSCGPFSDREETLWAQFACVQIRSFDRVGIPLGNFVAIERLQVGG
jgi:hypothetical protein